MAETRTFTFYRRVTGSDIRSGPCTNQVELSEDRRGLFLRLASTARFSILLNRSGVTGLIDAVADTAGPAPSDVTGTHDLHGVMRMRVTRPADGRAVTLTLAPGDDEISVVFTSHQREELLGHLRGGLDLLRGP
ncbi:hypothetical protein G443_002280 [Actinoalloteichus cyanogriseus DSM 43889]|uniref:Uncharacterized protein n=2 Tax=Pseudonocardiaceae TaxID=2070 RepID=A0ABT1JHM1_ACTCY|nr:hypothetical protein [Actinoalloteichus caeruleus DSM 43889]